MKNKEKPKRTKPKRNYTHLLVAGTFVRLNKLLRTERKLAKIWANGVTMRSSPWLKKGGKRKRRQKSIQWEYFKY